MTLSPLLRSLGAWGTGPQEETPHHDRQIGNLEAENRVFSYFYKISVVSSVEAIDFNISMHSALLA